MMKHRETRRLLLLFMIAAAVLLLFHYMRFNSTEIAPFYEQYEHFVNMEDPGRDTIYLGDSMLSNSKDYLFLARLLPYLAGLANIYLSYLILKKIVRSPKQRFLTLLIMILSPLFLYFYGAYNPLFLSMSFMLLGINLVLRERHSLSLLSFLAAFAFNPRIFFGIIITLIIIFEKLKSKKMLFPFLGLLAVALSFVSIYSLGRGITSYGLVTGYVSDLGATAGLSIFTIILFGLGIIISWKDKGKNSMIYTSLIIFLLFSLFDPRNIIFADLIISYYAGMALYTMMNRKWSTSVLKNYVILLILCGLIFSSGAYIKRVSEIGPNDTEMNSLKWLGSQETERRVLSHHEYGSFIEYASGLEPYTDLDYFLYSKNRTRIFMAEKIFQSRNEAEIKQFLDRARIGYIWINREMSEGQVWKKDDEGILLVLQTGSSYRKVYDYDGIQIWEYLP